MSDGSGSSDAERLLAEAAALPPPRREAFVEARTEGRPELRDEVLSLLRHLEPAELFFGRLGRPRRGPG